MLCGLPFQPDLATKQALPGGSIASSVDSNVAAAAKPATQPAVTSSPGRRPAVPGDFVLGPAGPSRGFVLGRRGEGLLTLLPQAKSASKPAVTKSLWWRSAEPWTLSWAGGAEPETLSLAGGGGVTDPSPPFPLQLPPDGGLGSLDDSPRVNGQFFRQPCSSE